MLVALRACTIVILLAANAWAQTVEEVSEAIYDGRADIVKKALEAGFDPNSVDEYGAPLLYLAADGEQPGIAEMLLARGADVNAAEREFGITALGVASAISSDSMVDFLLENGADPKKMDKFGGTALEEAAFAGSQSIVAKFRRLGMKSRWPLHVAAGIGEMDVLKKLAADPQTINKPTKGWGNTPLMFAVGGLQVVTTKHLLTAGANPNLPNRFECFPLHYAASAESREVCEALLAGGADINARVGQAETPLDYAEYADPEFLNWFISKGGRPGEDLPAGKTLREWWAKSPAKPKPQAAKAE